MAGHSNKQMQKTSHPSQPWPGNVICRCGLRSDHKVHGGK